MNQDSSSINKQTANIVILIYLQLPLPFSTLALAFISLPPPNKPHMPIPPPPIIMLSQNHPLPCKVLRVVIIIMILDTLPPNINHISLVSLNRLRNPAPRTPQTTLHRGNEGCPQRPSLFPPRR